MSQYTEGVCSVELGSQLVTGVGTKWLNIVKPGDMFVVTDNSYIYEVSYIASDTQLYLSTAYQQLSNTSATYALIRDFTPYRKYPELKIGDREPSAIISKAFEMIDIDIQFLRALKWLEVNTYEAITVAESGDYDSRNAYDICYISEYTNLFVNALELSESITITENDTEFTY